MRCAARTHVGGRTHNEDAMLASRRLLAVADGVGGAVAGEVASSTVIGALAHLDKCRLTSPLEEALPAAIERGNEALRFVGLCRPEMAGMATTVTAVALSDAGRYLVANVGDSRTYLRRDGLLRQLTRDDSLVQHLLDRGMITAEEVAEHPQRSVVLEALDGRARRRVVVADLAAQAGDRLLLCSDGLSDVLGLDALAAGLAPAACEDAAERLIAAALAAEARDNVSVVVADVLVADAGARGWLPVVSLPDPTRARDSITR